MLSIFGGQPRKILALGGAAKFRRKDRRAGTGAVPRTDRVTEGQERTGDRRARRDGQWSGACYPETTGTVPKVGPGAETEATRSRKGIFDGRSSGIP